MQSSMVARVRRFNRTVTQRIGALDEAYLAHNRPLGQCRVLWEIGPAGREVRELRTRLDLDSGYLSRMLRALAEEGLVELTTDPADARVRTARLTEAGLAERAELDRRSDALAGSMLSPLNDTQRDRLIAAMAEVERLLTASTVEVVELDPWHPQARQCMNAYFAEIAERFDNGYDPALAAPGGDGQLAPPHGVWLVARLHGEPVGCGGLKLHGDWAEITRVWVSDAVRGLGLGRRLLAELESRAASRDVGLVRLDTNRVLTEAIQLYRAEGYREIPRYNENPYAHHWFEKTLGS